MPFTREDWNNIINSVNGVITNAPAETDCESLPPIDTVGPGHLWSKSDIQEVQDALRATCPSISFSEIPDLWKQSIVDEINEAIGQAWCDCEPDEDECDEEAIAAEDGLEILIFDNGPAKVVSTCLGTDTPPIALAPLINGLVVGAPGILARGWRVVRRNHRNDGVVTQSSALASGTLSCQGVVSYGGIVQLTTAAGVAVACGDCESEGCADALADAADQVANSPTVFYNSYHLILSTSSAFCNPEDVPCT